MRADGRDNMGTGTYWILSWETVLAAPKVTADWDVPRTCLDYHVWTNPGTSGSWRFIVSDSPCGARPATVRAWLETGEQCSVSP